MQVQIDTTTDGLRLDKALSILCPDFSRTRIKDLILKQRVSLNQKVISDPNFKVSVDQIFQLEDPFLRDDALPMAEKIPLDIIYEDDDIIVLNKPAGLVVHPAPGNYTGTLVNALIYYLGSHLSTVGGPIRPGIVHRLDKETSGLMVVAKTDSAHQGLAEQFSGRLLSRTYRALVMGAPIPPLGTIHTNIGPSLRQHTKMSVQKFGGREAITHYKTLDSYTKQKPLTSLIECKLETGRTHQIRVHMAHIKHPVVGDTLYGKNHIQHPVLQKMIQEGSWSQNRHALHAKNIQFLHPISNEEMYFETDLPPDFALLQKFLSY